MERILCTLQDMLDARDRRRERQALHFRTAPADTLVVATVVAPGERKLTPEADVVARAMVEAIRAAFGDKVISLKHIAPVSGHEVWMRLSCCPQEAKRRAVDIEDTHPLGRLFDIDVIMPDLRPMGRTDLGLPPRRCLLCDSEARLCMRARTHTPEEIRHHIERLTRDYANPD